MAKDLIPSSSWERPRSPLAQTTLCGGASEGAKLSLENACPLRGVCRPWEGSRMAWRVAPLCKGGGHPIPALREPGALWGELIIEPSLREPTLIFINLQDKASRAVLLRRL